MNENKQFEEMTKDIVRMAGLDVYQKAEYLITQGYRKIDNGSVVLTEEEYESLEEYREEMEEIIKYREKKVRKQAVKEFAKMYKDHVKNYTGMFTEEGFMVNLQAVLTAVAFIAAKEFEVEVE